MDISPRDVARATKLETSKLRTTALHPDFVEGVVTGQAADGRYLFKRDDWSGTIKARCVPGDAKIPYPIRMKAFCEDGSVQKLFLRWHKKGIKYEIEETLGLGWPNRFRSGGRVNSVESLAFNETAAAVNNTPIGPDIGELRQWNGNFAWHNGDTKLYFNGVEIWDGASLGSSFYYFSGGISYQDGVIYALHSDCGMVAVRDTGEFLWNQIFFNDWGISGPGGWWPGTWETGSDPVVVGSRVVALGFRTDLEDGAQVLCSIKLEGPGESFAGVHNRWITPAFDYFDTMIIWNRWTGRPALWVDGTKVYFTEYSGRAVCYSVNAEDITTVWISDLDFEGGIERRRQILGIVNGSLICAFEQHEWRWVEDNLLLENRWDAAVDTENDGHWSYEDPEVLAVGLQAGVEALSLADGSLLGETLETGEEDWQTRIGPMTDYLSYGGVVTLTGLGKWFYEVGDPQYDADSDGNPDPQPSEDYFNNEVFYVEQRGSEIDFLTPRKSPGNPGLGIPPTYYPQNSTSNKNYFEKSYDPTADPDWLNIKTYRGVNHDFQHDAGAGVPGPVRLSLFHSFGHPVSSSAEAYGNGMNSAMQAFEQAFVDEFEQLAVSHRLSDTEDVLVGSIRRVKAAWLVSVDADGADPVSGEQLTYQDPPLSHLHLPDTAEINDYFVETAGTDRFTSGGNPQAGAGDEEFWGRNLQTSCTVSHRYHWRTIPERHIKKSSTPTIRTGMACNVGGQLIVAGSDSDKIQWRAYNHLAEEQWRYEVEEAGGESILLWGAPFGSAVKIHTHFTRDGGHRLITLDAGGTKLSEVICSALRDPIFDGVNSFVAHDGQSKFG